MDTITYQKQLAIFKDWFELWQTSFNLTRLEKAYNIPPKSIYKHFNGHQVMAYKHWCSLYEGMKDMFLHHPTLFIDK